MNRGALIIGTLAGLIAAAGTALAVDREARLRLSAEQPAVRYYQGPTKITRVYGPAFSTGKSAVESAENFLSRHAGVLGASAADLVPRSLNRDGLNTTPLMPDGQGGMKFTLVSYSQQRDGVPVFNSHVGLLTRNVAGSPLVLVTNALFELGNFHPDPAVAANPAWDAAFAAAAEALPATRGGRVSAPEVVIWAGTELRAAAPTLAVVFLADSAVRAGEEGFGQWRVVADAATGAVLHTESTICHVDVHGQVTAMVTDGIRSAECDPEAARGLPDVRVTSGAAVGYADANGNFALDVPAGSVTVSASARGRDFRVYNPGVDAPATSVTVNQGDPANILLNEQNTSEARRAEVNAYLQSALVRHMMLNAAPGYPTISRQTEGDLGPFRVNVMVAGNCNAFYMASDNGGMGTTNFYTAGGGCPDMAYMDIVHHEYGHHLVQTGGSLQDQYGEGMSDCMGVLMTDQAGLAWGFFGNCNTPLRNADNTVQYPCNGEIHDCGQLISGCLWDTREAMVASAVPDYRTLLQRLFVNSVPLHAGQGNIAPDITVDILTLDDNDGNIGNGTPHYSQIQAGFSVHNMPGPALDLGHIDFPDGRPISLSPDTPVPVRVTVTGVAATPIDGNASLISRINNGTEVVTPLTRTGENQYVATLPGTPCLSTLSYAFLAATSGGTVRSPSGNAYYTALSAGAAHDIFSDNFSTDQGWQVSVTAGATGGFVRSAPVASSGAPTADFDGDGMCYVTGPASGTDIDGGSVRVFTPRLDARGGLVYISYARWFSNNTGTNPGQDTATIDVSGDDGVHWTVLEILGPGGADASGGWIQKSFQLPAAVLTDRFRFRFTASDRGLDATVEAGLDAVRLIEFGCDLPCGPDFNGDGFLDFFDFSAYVDCFNGYGCPAGKTADYNGDGFVDFFDIDGYTAAFEAGC